MGIDTPGRERRLERLGKGRGHTLDLARRADWTDTLELADKLDLEDTVDFEDILDLEGTADSADILDLKGMVGLVGGFLDLASGGDLAHIPGLGSLVG